MSTILDALRKLQRERAAENPSRDLRGSITTETPAVVPEKRRGRSVWIALLLLVVALASAATWLYRSGAIAELPTLASDDEGAASEAELEAAAREAAAVPEASEPAPSAPAPAAPRAVALPPVPAAPSAPVPDTPEIAAERARLEAALANARAAQQDQAVAEAEAARQAQQAASAAQAAAAPPPPSAPAPVVVAKSQPEAPKAPPKPAPKPAARKPAAAKPAAAKPASPEPSASRAEPAQPTSVFPSVQVESIRWHPIPERRVASLRFEQQDAPEAREGDIVAGVLIYRIDPGAVELRIGSAQRVVSPEP